MLQSKFRAESGKLLVIKCYIYTRRNIPSLTILWLALPFIWLWEVFSLRKNFGGFRMTYQANPTPQASFSSPGSYNPLFKTIRYSLQIVWLLKLTASREELLPKIHCLLSGTRIDDKVRSLLQFVCVCHRTRERPYQPSL